MTKREKGSRIGKSERIVDPKKQKPNGRACMHIGHATIQFPSTQRVGHKATGLSALLLSGKTTDGLAVCFTLDQMPTFVSLTTGGTAMSTHVVGETAWTRWAV